MKFCCILLLLIITCITGYESVSSVTVKLHESAVLSCSEKCSGSARWIVSDDPGDILVECDRTSCKTVKGGYQMKTHQKGDFSLIISKTDFSKRNAYKSLCNRTEEMCTVLLQVTALRSTVQKTAGESLVMKVDVSDAVEVIYSRTEEAGESSDQICTVRGSSLQCKPEYKPRTSLISSDLELRNMKKSESGVYIIRDIRTKDDIHIYTVIVEKPPLPGWATALIVLAALLVLVLVVVLVLIICEQVKKLKQAQLEREIPKVKDLIVGLSFQLIEFLNQRRQLQESGADLKEIRKADKEIQRVKEETASQEEELFNLQKLHKILSGKEGIKEKYLLIFCPSVSRRRLKELRVKKSGDAQERLAIVKELGDEEFVLQQSLEKMKKENHGNMETERKRIIERLRRIRDEKNLWDEEEKLNVSLKELPNEFYEDMKTDSGRKWMKERLTRINEQLDSIIRVNNLWDVEKKLKQWLKEKENHKDTETETECKQIKEKLERIKEELKGLTDDSERLKLLWDEEKKLKQWLKEKENHKDMKTVAERKQIKERLKRIKEDLKRITDISNRVKLLWDEEKKLNLWLKENENHKDMETEAERKQIKEKLKRIKEDLKSCHEELETIAEVKLSHDEDLERLTEVNNAAGDEEREKLIEKSEKIHFEDEKRRRNMELEEIVEDVL